MNDQLADQFLHIYSQCLLFFILHCSERFTTDYCPEGKLATSQSRTPRNSDSSFSLDLKKKTIAKDVLLSDLKEFIRYFMQDLAV